MSNPDSKSQFDDDVEIQATRSSRPWSRRAQLIGAVGWASFLVAAAGAVVFFAFVDPAEIELVPFGLYMSRMTGYAIGFFFFWFLAAAAAATAIFISRRSGTERPER